jgi:BMFP domain-containing protein YqiC
LRNINVKTNELLDRFLHQFNNIMVPGAETLNKELQQKMRVAAQATFDKLDLVTRDEFDAQRAVLDRTRDQLESIKKQLTGIEESLSTKYR